MVWSEEKIQFLSKYYPNFGGEWCAQQLNLKRSQIISKANSLGIHLIPELYILKKRRPNNRLLVNPDQFLNPTTKEVAYILGVLWGDGHIVTHNSGVELNMIYDDFKDIENVFLLTGKWGIYKRQRKHWKLSTTVRTHSKVFYEFLEKHGYKTKHGSADSILSIIPDHLKKYWFRGISDADGCFYYDNKHCCQYCVAGPYDQDWMYMENIFKHLGIRFKVKRRIHKKSKSSFIRVTSKYDVIKFADYIYSDYDNIGLQRKYQKYLYIKNIYQG